ncbi:MAG: FMN-binding protein [Bacilli bacterium]|nr:FMN-binding protein [Bacilli bacterium]MBN2877870.1 FMN-binding protein [Bacilli bacterium]
MNKLKRIGLLVFVIVVLLTAGIVYVVVMANDNMEMLMVTPVEELHLDQTDNGVYVGECDAFPIHVIVEVTITDHEIESIDIIMHQNGQGEPAEVIIDDVVLSQSIDVDTIAGATYSSKAILLAISDALKQ